MKRYRLFEMLAMMGSGIFAIGYTIGTGSVTSMAKAGADYGFGLLWVLALSCLFSGVMMTAYGRFAVVTGETALHGMIRFLPGGKLIAALVFLGVTTAQYTCLGGILILTSGALHEVFALDCGVFPIACAIISIMYAMLLVGRYSFFEKLLAFFVMLMALTFVVSVFVTWPNSDIIKRTALPILPVDGASLLMLAAFVGTTMAAPTFVTRPLLIREKGFGMSDLRLERIDACVSASLMFVISGAIVTVATGVLYSQGKGIEKILDMASTLEPVAGRFAVAFFMVGTLAAGLSSIFPIMMVGPLLIGDWRNGRMESRTKTFRFACLLAALWGLVVPAIGKNPVTVTVAAQVSNVFVLPLTVAAIAWLLNRRDVMGMHCAGWIMNSLLAVAFAFSLAVVVSGVKAIKERFAGTVRVGAGTVMTSEQLTMCEQAGGEFMISPNVNVDLIHDCVSRGLVALPGAMTPSEAVAAYDAGAEFVKIFPAGSEGLISPTARLVRTTDKIDQRKKK